MLYPTPTRPTNAPAFIHEFDSRVMPGNRWEPGSTISVPKNKKPENKTPEAPNKTWRPTMSIS